MTHRAVGAGGPDGSEEPGRRAPAIYRFLNAPMRALLRSRAHGVVSGQVMLLEYTGRRTGRMYAIPVGYFAWEDGSVLAFSGSRWWRNLRDGRPVSLLVGRVRHPAVPTVVESLDARVEQLATFVRRYGPRVAARLQVGLPSDREPTPDELRSAVARKILIRFDPVDSQPIARMR